MAHTGADASWRLNRTAAQASFFTRLRAQGIPINPIMGLPFVTGMTICIDFLHTFDQGVSAEFLGNLFWWALPLLGVNRKNQVAELWRQMLYFYEANQVSSRLSGLALADIRRDSKGPRLRGKASQIKALVRFGSELAARCRAACDPAEVAVAETVQECAAQLAAIYGFLLAPAWPAEEARDASVKFATLYAALRTHAEAVSGPAVKFWKVKPKLHLGQELLEYMAVANGSPRQFWAYRDEDWAQQTSTSMSSTAKSEQHIQPSM